jgi:tRNA (adenine-N(1)-)-methyltransferase non-catalytic subunit
MRSNRETIDDSARQTLTMDEIETLKKDATSAGKDLIAKLMLSHTKLDEKTAFSLAKYKLLKTKKYLRQFTVLPLDVATLTEWLIEDKDPTRIMEMREELLALVGCWGNVHFVGDLEEKSGRWLVVDEVGGLLVAAMAERMGVLVPEECEEIEAEQTNGEKQHHPHPSDEKPLTSNTITLIHPNAQPNLSLLKYFDFQADTPSPSHPLTKHLHTISWLQLLSPEIDTTYACAPPTSDPETISSWKSGKRGTYYRKHRRYNKVRHVVDETRKGGFDGLLVASAMDPVGIMKACVPLLRGGAQVAIYSPTVEPLVQLADCYSTSRRTAYIQNQNDARIQTTEDAENGVESGEVEISEEDFPLNPTLLLNTSVQTSKIRKWQVLPGRTHPLMTGRGGAEGYVFTGTRVLPAEGKVEARGKYKRRKTEMQSSDVQPDENGSAEEELMVLDTPDVDLAAEWTVEANVITAS